MFKLKKCWTPFMVYSWTSVKYGCYYSAMYTGIAHALFICYSMYVMDGGKSDEFYGPFFELNRSGAIIAGSLSIVYCFFFLGASIMLVAGVKKENRCMFFPWMIGMSFEIFGAVALCIWFLFRYHDNPMSIFACIVLLVFDGLHVYCMLCVISQYQTLRDLQEPRFIILYP